MNKIFYALILLVILGCKSTMDHSIKTIEVSENEVKSSLEYLASDGLEGRNTGSKGIEKAAVFIENIFKENNIKPYFETYRDSFNVKEVIGYNVIGYIEGNDPNLKKEFVILGAHYDHIGTVKMVNGDVIANGANDNATGTSAVIAMAKYFAEKKNNKRSIMFTLFSAEEKGLLGSKYLSKRLKGDNLNLYTMVNFEMIGVPFKDRGYEVFVSGYDMSNMAKKINAYTESNLIGKSEIALKYSLFKRSDNYPFYTEFNVPCQTISSCDMTNFDFYHHVDDEIDKLDFKFMQRLINKIIPAIEKMSNTPTKEIKLN